MLRIIADRSGGLTRVFHDQVELRNISKIVVMPIFPGKPIKALVEFFDVVLDARVEDREVRGLPPVDVEAKQPVEPVAPARRPIVTRGKLPIKVGVGSVEATLLNVANEGAKR